MSHLCCFAVHICNTEFGCDSCIFCLHYREQYRFAKSEATVVDQKVRLVDLASGMCMWSDSTKEYSEGLAGNLIQLTSASLIVSCSAYLSWVPI